jgi:hypothetical protein
VRLASARHVLFGVAGVLAVATGGTLAPAGGTAAQTQPTMVISPSSGPCDAEIQVTGSGFPMPSGPYPFVTVYLLQPGIPDVNMHFLTRIYVYEDGTLGWWTGPLGGCQAAALDSQAEQPTGRLVVAVMSGDTALDPGARIPDIMATAQYAYTTTAPPPQPTMALSPSSGPCDALLEVVGRGFPPPPGPMGFYLLQPGTTDVNMDTLGGTSLGSDGAAMQWVPLRDHGCEAAALDSQSERATGDLVIAAAPTEGPVASGERIQNIIAVAHYSYTTTTPPPPPVMVVSPSSGPCDGTLEVTGNGFQPDQAVSLGWAYPSSEAPVGILASVSPDAEGTFVAQLTLGKTGCDAARTYPSTRDPLPPRLRIDAQAVGTPQQVGSHLAFVVYTFTTTEVGGGMPPQALPSTGSGPGQTSARPTWLAMTAVLAGVGLVLVAASVYRRRQHG